MKILNLSFILAVLFFIQCKEVPQEANPTNNDSTYYTENFRPQFHFTPEANWMNDPNGMVYLDGEYHLFYQYYPDSTVWGPMHWAHAVSTDLVKWEHLPIALYPDSLGYIFSGSAVIDKNNTAGFGKDAMIAIYTYHNMEGEKSGTSTTYQYQAIAYSTDKGRTFTKYEGNPVVPNPGIKDFRDPKVIWDDNSDQWVMIFAAHDHLKMYGSPNLKDWTHLSDWGHEYGEHGGIWECPDLFPMVTKNTGETKWVILESLNPGAPNGGSGTQYFIGDFDGKNFIIDPAFATHVPKGRGVWLDYGKDNYAGVTWSNISKSDNRKLFIGWMSNWEYAQIVPTEKWRSAMTIPRELSLYKEEEGYRIRSNPISELNSIETETIDFSNKELDKKSTLIAEGNGLYKIELSCIRPNDKPIVIKCSNSIGELIYIGYDPIDQKYFVDRSKSGTVNFHQEFPNVQLADVFYNRDHLDLLIYVDHSSVELFADKGKTVMTSIFFPSKPYDKVELIYGGIDQNKPNKLQLTELENIWR